MTTTSTVRFLVPDHVALSGVAWQAEQFLGRLRAAASLAGACPPDLPWNVPDTLTDASLEATWRRVFGPWSYWLGGGQPERPYNPTARFIAFAGGGRAYQSVYAVVATPADVNALLAARALLQSAAGDDGPAEITDLGDLLAGHRHADDPRGYLALLRLLGMVDVATADEPLHQDRRHIAQPVPPRQDVDLLLAEIDGCWASDDKLVLDGEVSAAYRRLDAEWHHVIYGDQANSPEALTVRLAPTSSATR